MSRSKKLYLLLGVLALVCAAAFGAVRWEEHKERIRTSEDIILSLPGEDVTALSWERDGETLAFHKDGDWRYDGDEAFPVSGERMDELLELFEAFGVSFTIEDVEDYSQYGLDDPVCTIRLTAGEQTHEIQLGGYSTMDSKRYVSIGDGKVYLVQNDPLDLFDTDLSGLIKQDQIPAFGQVTRLRFSGGEDYAVQYQEGGGVSYRDSDVYDTERGGDRLPLDTAKVERYVDEVSGLSLTNYVTYNATDEELEGYGLDQPELTVEVDYEGEKENGGGTLILHVSRDPAEREAEEDGSGDGTITAYARVGDSPIVYRITSSAYTSLMAASYDDLRHGEVLPAEIEDISQLDVSLEGRTYTFTSEEKDGEQVWSCNGEELEESGLQNALEGLSASSFTEEQPEGKQEIGLTVRLDREGEPAVQIGLYRYDGASCLAVVDGESVSLVDRSDVVALIEAVNAIVLD